MTKFRVYKTSLESRERNRMHARKTRQRKKEHMSTLQDRCAKLKNDQLSLRQSINEKNTASILLGMFGKSASVDAASASVDAKVDALLKRSVEDIPDASKIPELPALILPGQHSSKKIREAASAAVVAAVSGDEGDAMMAGADPAAKPLHPAVNAQGHLPDDGIDYELLSKDRSKCTPAELDQIRRERNRMHAKRTRDRKRIFMEEMEVMIRQLEEENQALQDHLDSLNANGDANGRTTSVPASAPISTDTTPSLGPSSPRMEPSASNTPILSAPIMLEDSHQEEVTLTLASLKSSSTGKKRPLPIMSASSDVPKQSPGPSPADTNKNGKGITVDQIKDLLHTAGELDKNSAIAGMLSISSSVASNASPVSVQNSDDEDERREESEDDRSSKRQCIAPSSAPVPASC